MSTYFSLLPLYFASHISDEWHSYQGGKEEGKHMLNPSYSASKECHQHPGYVLLRVFLSSLSSSCLERRKESSLPSRGQDVLNFIY